MLETMEALELAVYRNLSTGKCYAIKGKLLAERLGEKDTRKIRLAIMEIIKSGIPVVSGPTGYFIAETPEECAECLEVLNSYIEMTSLHRKYLKFAAEKKFVGQMKLGI